MTAYGGGVGYRPQVQYVLLNCFNVSKCIYTCFNGGCQILLEEEKNQVCPDIIKDMFRNLRRFPLVFQLVLVLFHNLSF